LGKHDRPPEAGFAGRRLADACLVATKKKGVHGGNMVSQCWNTILLFRFLD